MIVGVLAILILISTTLIFVIPKRMQTFFYYFGKVFLWVFAFAAFGSFTVMLIRDILHNRHVESWEWIAPILLLGLVYVLFRLFSINRAAKRAAGIPK